VIGGVDGPGAARLQAIGVPVTVLGEMGAGTPLELASRFRRERPALLHLHGSRAGLLGALAARLAGVAPVVYTAHMFSFRRQMPAPLVWLATRAERLTAAIADRVICVSASDRDAAAARGLPSARLTVVPNGIDMSRFPAREDRRAELGIDRDAPVVGMVGRLVEQKDPLAFAALARAVAERSPAARFLVVGDGPLRPALEHACAELLAQGRLTVTGFRDDVPELLATLDVVVFPARWEAQGLALIEAMAAGRAVVATGLPAHAEAVDHERSGLLVPVGDAAELARAVSGLLEDAAWRRELGGRARASVESRYRIETMVDATAEVYRAVIASAGSRPAFHAA
jgi:glycosyltransferase involved in cell wall biosynthesis